MDFNFPFLLLQLVLIYKVNAKKELKYNNRKLYKI